MSIRTTVTLDDDVVEQVKQASRARGKSFRETLNELIRARLLSAQKSPRRAYRLKPSNMGLRPGLNCDNIEALLEYGESSLHR
jgi:hypothetical protein